MLQDTGRCIFRDMNVRDVMTVSLITVDPETPVKDCVVLMLQAHIGGLPVVSGDVLVGIMTASDVLSRNQAQSHAPVARDVMTADPTCLQEETSVAAAARTFARHQIKRAPIVRGARLVGIVTRSDLLRPYLRTDSEIEAEIEDDIIVRGIGLRPNDIQVRVSRGVVELHGTLPRADLQSMLLLLVRRVDGVVDVWDDLSVSTIPISAAAPT